MPLVHMSERRGPTRVECRRGTGSARRYPGHFGFTLTSDHAQVMSLMWRLGPNVFEFSSFRESPADDRPAKDERVDVLWSVPAEAMGLEQEGAGISGTRAPCRAATRAHGLVDPVDGHWHHSGDGASMMYVDRDIHGSLSHVGDASINQTPEF